MIVFTGRGLSTYISIILMASSLCAAFSVVANPESGLVIAGQASISNSQPNATLINQVSDKAIIEWQSFNVAQQEKVHFQQPPAGVCLNRINAKHGASEILGQITATGTIALVNQAGIIFGPNAHVNVGSLAASTADIANENFMQGKYKFDQPSVYRGKVINHGKITAKDKGMVALIGAETRNDGMIQAKSGNVVLSSGKNVTLDFNGDGLICFAVPDLESPAGAVLVSKDVVNGVLDAVINTASYEQATTVQAEDGNVIFSGGSIDVSGENGGGTVLINAQNISVAHETTINADAIVSGDGGKIVTYADKTNAFAGTVSARGGKESGKGGFLEVSGKENIRYDGRIDMTAEHGAVGTLLLDPQFLVVATAGGSAYSAGVNNLFANNSGGTNTLTPASIVAAFVGANVVLQANTDVTFTDVLTSATSGRTLTVKAGRSILVNSNVTTVNAAISMTANDSTAISSDRLSGVGNITVAPGTTISAGTGSLSLIVDPSIVLPFSPGGITGGGFTGGAVSLSTPNALTGVNNIASSAGLTVNVGTASSLSGGVISGTTLTKLGAGALTLSGINTYTGLTTINEGTISVVNNSGLGTTAAGVIVANGATLDLNGVTIGAEPLTLNGDGVGGGGALTGTGTSSLSGAITLASSSSIGGTGTLTLSGIIADGTSTFNMTKTGSGTVILTAANTYDGATNINQGILRAGIANAIASTNTLNFANVVDASFDLNGLAQTVGNLSGGGSLGGNISLGAATLTVTQGLSTDFNGVISGAGGLTKNGSGMLSLGGVNLYTGTTTINAGTLMPTVANAIANSTALTMGNVDGAIFDLNNLNQAIGSLSGGGTTGGNVSLGSGNLTINQAATLTYTGVISGTGGIVKNGVGTLSLAGLNTYSGPTTINLGILAPTVANAMQFTSALNMANVATATFQMNATNQTIGSLSGGGASGGNITLGTGILTINQTVDGTYDGVKSSTGGITKAGHATLTLTRVNSYTGATTVSAGTLRAGVDNVINLASTLTLANTSGAIFDLNNFHQSIARLSGGGTSGGNITLGSATLTVNQGAAATYSGVISGTGGFIKAGASTLSLGGVNTYTGPTSITAGSLQPVVDNVIQNSSALSITNLATAVFALNGTNQTVGSLSGGGALGGNITLGLGVLTINQSALGSYDGIISGAGDVIKAGASTLTLTRASTYTGSTTINAGILRAGIINAIAATSALNLANITGASFDLNNFSQTVASLNGGGSLGGNISLGSGTLTLTQNLPGIYSGIISGSGSLTKNGSALLSLGGVNIFTGTTTINAGTLKATVADTMANTVALTLANTDGVFFDLNDFNQTVGSLSGGGTTGGNILLGSANLTVNQAATLTYTGVISGTGGLVKNGAGTLSLAGLNRYSGPTTVNLGILSPTLANGINFTSSLTLANVATAAFQLNSVTQTVGNLFGGGASGGNVTLGSGTLIVTQSTPATYDGVMSGTGGLTKNGAATLTLSRVNTYTGATTINSGTLRAGIANVINSASSMVFANFAGAIFDLNNFPQSVGRLTGGGTLGGNITLGTADLSVNQATAGTYSGIISGSGGITKIGAAALSLGGINTYTGPTTISAGALQAVVDNVIQQSSALSIANLATAIFNLNSTNQSIGSLSGGGVLGGNITLGIGNLTINQSAVGTYDGIISGAGDVTKAGASTLTLSRANAYTGSTYINVGILRAGIANVIATSNNLVLANVAGAAFDLNSLAQGVNNLSGGGSLGGNVTLGSATLTVTENLPSTYSGIISGTGGLAKSGSSILSLGGTNTYSGTTVINAGTLRMLVANAIANTSALTTANTNGAIFDLNNTDQTVGSLSGGGTTGGDITLGSGTLTVNQTGALTYSGIINGTGGLIKGGAATLSLGAANTYTGPTTINLGILQPTVTNAIANTSSLIMADIATTTFNLNNLNQAVGSLSGGGAAGGNITLGSGILTVTQSTAGTYDGIMSGTGGITKAGAAVLTLSRGNTYTGTTTINAGILRAGIANAIQNSAQITLANVSGAGFDLNNFPQTVGRPSGGGSLGGNITLGSADLTVNQATSATTYSGVISGTGGLTKTGALALNLGGVNTYTGVTTILAGTLQPVVNNAIQKSSGLVMANVATAIFNLNNTNQIIGNLSGGGATGGNISLGTGTLTITQNLPGTYDGVLSGPGNITKIGTDTLILSRTNTFTGNTNINAGVLSVSADLKLGAAPGAATAGKLTFDGGTLRTTTSFTLNANRGITLNSGGGTFLVDPTFTLTYNGIATGIGALTKSGTSTLVLGGANTYSGATIINAGTIQTTVANAIANTSALTLANFAGAVFDLNNTNQTVGSVSGGGTAGGNITMGSGSLKVDQTVAGTFAGFITGTGGLTLSNSSTNTLTLGNAGNSYSGNTTLNGGTLSISADGSLGIAPGVATPGKLAFNGGTLKNTGSYILNANRGIALNASGGTIEVDTGATVNYNGIMAGAGTFTKTGNGSLILGGINSYTGNTAINAGTVSVTNITGLNAATNISVASGGTLDLNFNTATFTNTNPIILNGTNALTLSGANITVNNPLTVSGNTSIGGVGTGIMTFGGPISGAANLTFALTNAGLSLPTTTLTSSGALSVATSGPITQTGALTIPGTASFSAGANPITLTLNNNFTGAVSLNNSGANNVAVINSGALVLGTSSVGSNLNLTAGGSITQNGSLTATGGTTTLAVTAPNSDILLGQANNFDDIAPVFAGTQSNIRDVTLRNISAEAQTPVLSNLTNLRNLSLTFNAGNIVLSNLIASGYVTLIGNSADGSLNVGGLALGTNFANLTGYVAGLYGQEAINIITLLNVITSGTHYFDGIDMFLDTRPFNNVVQSLYGMLYYDWSYINSYMMSQLDQTRRCRIVGDKTILCGEPANIQIVY